MDNNSLSVLIRALDGFLFTVEDIVQMGVPGLVRKAGNHLKTNTPDICSEEVVSMLPELIMARCVSELAVQGEWIRYPIGSRSEIQFRILGMILTGIATISPKKIRVELHTDQGVLFRESVLPEWAPVIYTEEPVEGSLANREGVARAARLFLELCIELLGTLPSTDT